MRVVDPHFTLSYDLYAAFAALQGILIILFGILTRDFSRFEGMIPDIERVLAALKLPAQEDGSYDAPVGTRITSIVLDIAQFAYQRAMKQSKRHLDLQGISLEAKSGEVILLVGESGCGKSTLVRLLRRYFRHYVGEIWLQEEAVGQGQKGTTGRPRELREFTRASLSRLIAYAGQESIVVRGTVEENLKLLAPRATLRSLSRALDGVNFPQDLEQEVDPTLSGGEKQRLAAAGAIAKTSDASIFILDEPTTGLDHQTKMLVHEALCKEMENKITFCVSHDRDLFASILSHQGLVVRIVVMGDGKILEMGTHEELLQKDQGRYAALYEKISKG
jgi:ABC-type multidrug transport system fused ATPase/permease subunit